MYRLGPCGACLENRRTRNSVKGTALENSLGLSCEDSIVPFRQVIPGQEKLKEARLAPAGKIFFRLGASVVLKETWIRVCELASVRELPGRV